MERSKNPGNPSSETAKAEHSIIEQSRIMEGQAQSRMLTQIMRSGTKTPEKSFVTLAKSPSMNFQRTEGKNLGKSLNPHIGLSFPTKAQDASPGAVLSPFTIGGHNIRNESISQPESQRLERERLAQYVYPRYKNEGDRKAATRQLLERCKLPKGIKNNKGSPESSFTTNVASTEGGDSKADNCVIKIPFAPKKNTEPAHANTNISILPHVKNAGLWVGAESRSSSNKKLPNQTYSSRWNRSILGTTSTYDEYMQLGSKGSANKGLASPIGKAYYFKENVLDWNAKKRSQPSLSTDRFRFDEVSQTLKEAQNLLLSHTFSTQQTLPT